MTKRTPPESEALRVIVRDRILKTIVDEDLSKVEVDDVLHRLKSSLEKIYGQRFN